LAGRSLSRGEILKAALVWDGLSEGVSNALRGTEREDTLIAFIAHIMNAGSKSVRRFAANNGEGYYSSIYTITPSANHYY
jgi:hypothetical protein